MLSVTPKCLFFDVFGTCVDWRTSVVDALHTAAKATSDQPAASLSRQQWGDIAQQWRNSYLTWTKSVAADPTKVWKTVDEHHLESLKEILGEHDLLSSFDGKTIDDLALVWHALKPWADTNPGLQAINKKTTTCTLSNGNMSLLRNMVKNGAMPFMDIYSAELFQSYKPNSKVYLGAAARMGLEPGECAMVAAHLEDLKAAKSFGMQTIYVWRPQEERFPEMEHQGFVDMWIKDGEQGFITVAEHL